MCQRLKHALLILTCLFLDSLLYAIYYSLHATLSNVYWFHFYFSMIYSFSLLSDNWNASCCFMPLVTFVPWINSVAFSTDQCEQFCLAPYGPRASALILYASRCAPMLSRLFRVSALSSLSACHFTNWTFVGISLHHSS
jgi:hypothetical protein